MNQDIFIADQVNDEIQGVVEKVNFGLIANTTVGRNYLS